MTNAFYVKGAEKLLAPLIGGAALSGTLKAVAVKNTYVENLTTDEFYTSISAHVIGAPVTLASTSITGGKLDANDPVFAALGAGSTVEAIAIYMDTGNPATSPLLARIDECSGLPFTTDGGNFEPTWDNGPYKIVSLV